MDESGRVIAIAQKRNNLRHLVIDNTFTDKPSESAFVSSTPDSTFVPSISPSVLAPESILPEVKLPTEPTPKISGIEIWHKRLGHLHFDAVKRLANGMAQGISILPEEVTKTLCAACMAGKQHIAYGKNKMKRATRPLERIHSDTSGMLPLGTCGSRYFILFINYFT